MLSTRLITESNEAYHARKSVSASMLKTLRKSPRIYQAEIIERRIERKESAAMRLGTAIHSRILEPFQFAQEYTVCPEQCSDRRTKAYKEWEADNSDRIILAFDECRIVNKVAASVHLHPIASRIVDRPDFVEKSFEYDDLETGVCCRVRFDGIKGGCVFDIKTISECDNLQIKRDAKKYGYHIQAAHYLEGLDTIAPEVPWVFMFIFVETAEPFRCKVFQPAPRWLNYGRKSRHELLKDLQDRLLSNDWSEAAEQIVNELDFPDYYEYQESEV